MQIFPVLDLQAGLVVRGIAGRRSEYRPIVSPLVEDARPLTVARAFEREFGLRELYLADLDAIAGASPAWGTYAELLESGFDLWVDAGVSVAERCRELASFTAGSRTLAQIVIGLESLAAPGLLDELLAIVGPRRLTFSLDLKNGRPLTDSAAWPDEPFAVASSVVAQGVQSLIVLDLADVGRNGGVRTADLCRRIRKLHPSAMLVAGGGLRSAADLHALAQAGVQGVLVASALHDGRLTPADVQVCSAK